VRARLEEVEALVGDKPKGRVELGFDVQLARLPDGTERRQAMTGNGAALAADTLALWIVEKPKKGRQLALLHVIPFHPKADVGRTPAQAFADNMRDFCEVNQRVTELRKLLEDTREPEGPDQRREFLDQLKRASAKSLKMRNPKNDSLVSAHAGPLERRVRERIEDYGDG
jgi:hypothetical protein